VARAKKRASKKIERMLVSELRKQLGFTQTELADSMGVTQSALSQIESRDDIQLSTLRRLVYALGGELDLVARFGDRAVVLHSSSASEESKPRRRFARAS
jgi:transcriptional regulator with XRE-family HTH domain